MSRVLFAVGYLLGVLVAIPALAQPNTSCSLNSPEVVYSVNSVEDETEYDVGDTLGAEAEASGSNNSQFATYTFWLYITWQDGSGDPIDSTKATEEVGPGGSFTDLSHSEAYDVPDPCDDSYTAVVFVYSNEVGAPLPDDEDSWTFDWIVLV